MAACPLLAMRLEKFFYSLQSPGSPEDGVTPKGCYRCHDGWVGALLLLGRDPRSCLGPKSAQCSLEGDVEGSSHGPQARWGSKPPQAHPSAPGLLQEESGGGWAQGPKGCWCPALTALPACLELPHSAGFRSSQGRPAHLLPVGAGGMLRGSWGSFPGHTPSTSRLRLPLTPPLCPSSSPGGPVAPSLFPLPHPSRGHQSPQQRLWAWS